jgi:hypothetical protein
MCLLILRSGDVEINPGPGVSSTPRLLTSDTSLSDDCLRIDNLIYFTCLNIQSFISKRDIIQAELNHRDVLLFTETWFNQNTSIDDITLKNYKIPYRCDRGGRVGGDVAIYVKENIYSEEKVELKQNGLESIWMKILTKGVDILFGLFYRPPDSENYIWDHINHSIDLVLNTSIDRIVICAILMKISLILVKCKLRISVYKII